MTIRRTTGLLLALALAGSVVTACTIDDPLARHRVPEGFEFVRDEAGVFPDDEEATAEGQLWDIARNLGVFGVVTSGDGLDNGDAALREILASVGDAEGAGLVAHCTPDDCDLTLANRMTPDLEAIAAGIVPAPEPVGGNPDAAAPDSLRAWVEFVGAVAGATASPQP
jgi:hypothetical protein